MGLVRTASMATEPAFAPRGAESTKLSVSGGLRLPLDRASPSPPSPMETIQTAAGVQACSTPSWICREMLVPPTAALQTPSVKKIQRRKNELVVNSPSIPHIALPKIPTVPKIPISWSYRNVENSLAQKWEARSSKRTVSGPIPNSLWC
jgi:hypothetical protein